MPTDYPHFRIAFWEDDHSKGHAALQNEFNGRTDAEAEIERQLSVRNYAVARLYGWDESRKRWTEIEVFPKNGPKTSHH